MENNEMREVIRVNAYTEGNVNIAYQNMINQLRRDISAIDECMHFAGFDVEGLSDTDEYRAKITNINFVYVGDNLLNTVPVDRGVWINLDGSKFVYKIYIKDCTALKPMNSLIDEGDTNHVWITECDGTAHTGIKVYTTLPTIVCKMLDLAVVAGTMPLYEMNV